ncbi:MAG: hypothetical protein K0S32_3722 [Bacteroidetes bacterium]|jgi:hypothetical protein|nr:hypothetical protein [Bacteroidota bacterium]
MKPKHFLVIAAIFISFISKAQEKTEYAIIEFNQSLKKEFQISINGKEYLEELADYSPRDKELHNANPFLNKINEYELKGWELISFHAVPIGNYTMPAYIAYLKKKKTEGK